MKVYLSGPMRGLPLFNFPAFHEAAAKLRAQGYDVANPAERDEAVFGGVTSEQGNEHEFAEKIGLSVQEFRRRVFSDDMRVLCESDAIALLPGWEASKGAQAEAHLADALGLEFIWL